MEANGEVRSKFVLGWFRRNTNNRGPKHGRGGLSALTVSRLVAASAIVLPVGLIHQTSLTTAPQPAGTCGSTLLSAANWQIPGGGVDVMSNGGDQGTAIDCVDPSGEPENSVTSPLAGVGDVNTGEEWQCPELVNRLYVKNGWIAKHWKGNGGDSTETANDSMWDSAPTDWAINNSAGPVPVFKQGNGSISYVGPSDVVSVNEFTLSGAFVPYGHVFIVNSSGTITSGPVPLVSQNAGSPSNADVEVTGQLSDGTLTVPSTSTRSRQVIGVVHAPTNNPGVSWAFSPSLVSAGKAVNLKYELTPAVASGEELALQRQFGSAGTWATFDTESVTATSATWPTPGEPIGSYGYRVRVLVDGEVVDQSSVQYLHSDGQVGLQVLCMAPGASNNSMNGCPAIGTATIGPSSFKYASHVSNNNQSVYPSFWDLLNFPATSCSSITVTFGMPATGSLAFDTAYLKVAQHGASAKTASARFGRETSFTVALDGSPWQIDNSSTSSNDQIVINATASCYTPDGAS